LRSRGTTTSTAPWRSSTRSRAACRSVRAAKTRALRPCALPRSARANSLGPLRGSSTGLK
jgi:hypothetical protein